MVADDRSGDHVHRLRLFCYRLRKAAAAAGPKNHRKRRILLILAIGITATAYGILNEIYAWKLILEQECFGSTVASGHKSSCFARTWERWRHVLTENDAKKLNIEKTAECKRIIRLGHWINKDGGWDICADNFPPGRSRKKKTSDVLMSSSDDDPSSATPCIVYSFGINDDASFDEDLVKRWPECQIYAFDPSIGRETGDNFLGPNIHFYNIGLGGRNVTKEDDRRGWQMMTLESIMAMLDHGHVNLLKMDIEVSEWETWMSWRQSGVHEKIGQLLGEIHFNRNDQDENIEHVATLGYLRDFGFHVFQRRLNFRWTRLMNVGHSRDSEENIRTYQCVELGWIRSSLSS